MKKIKTKSVRKQASSVCFRSEIFCCLSSSPQMIADLFECCFLDFVSRCNNNNVVEAKNKSCSMNATRGDFWAPFNAPSCSQKSKTLAPQASRVQQQHSMDESPPNSQFLPKNCLIKQKLQPRSIRWNPTIQSPGFSETNPTIKGRESRRYQIKKVGVLGSECRRGIFAATHPRTFLVLSIHSPAWKIRDT